ncbi:MAG: helix-turn-helix domain-containing protein [Elainella sp. Prado103]|jgi:transcriptional regulator with XRE-family HTH domain|nr:helix-turn-helix domain-containing protein [Elainella sp. Prado103]
MPPHSPSDRSNIAALREIAHLTQRQLADQVGVTETTIANWEQGRSGMEWIARLTRLCRALNCVLSDLIEVSSTGELMPRIMGLREQRQLTQRQLAEQISVTETTIANWERGRSGLEWIERLIRLCVALNCQLEDLIDSPETAMPGSRPSLAELLHQTQVKPRL